jgi:hypothetical protein
MKKLYLVKREVSASSIKEAMTAKGVIYEIQTADVPEKTPVGFKSLTKKK